MKIRERFRRFMLSMFDGVPYEEIERKNSQVSVSLMGAYKPVIVKAKRVYTTGEVMTQDVRDRAWNEIAQEFMPAVLDNMRRCVRYCPNEDCYKVSAELWLYPLDKENER